MTSSTPTNVCNAGKQIYSKKLLNRLMPDMWNELKYELCNELRDELYDALEYESKHNLYAGLVDYYND